MNEFERNFHGQTDRQTTGHQSSQPTNAKANMSDRSASGPYLVQQLAQAIRDFDREDSIVHEQPCRQPPAEKDIIAILMENAVVLQKAREYRLAMNILRTVLIRAPNHIDALGAMGGCLREEGRFEEALKCFRALLKLSANQMPSQSAEIFAKAEAQLLIAETLYLGERDQMSLAAYRDALKSPIREKSKLFGAYKNMGNIHVRAGDYESAEEFYNKAYVLFPESDVLMVNYGTLEIQRENLASAVERFRHAVALNPSNDKAWVGLALVHRQMGDRELSWANVQRALDIHRANRTAIRLVVEWGMADGDFSVAIRRLQEYLEIEGEDAEMSFTLAKIFTHLGRFREACIEMERVLALDPGVEGAIALKSALERELQARSLGSEKA